MEDCYKTCSVDRYESIKDFMRLNRKYPTDAEYVLWQCIRRNQLGVRFRRQHAVLDYIADFACLEKMIIIEVDGEYHLTEEQTSDDLLRTARLESMGWQIIRFSNNYVLNHINLVIDDIKLIINK